MFDWGNNKISQSSVYAKITTIRPARMTYVMPFFDIKFTTTPTSHVANSREDFQAVLTIDNYSRMLNKFYISPRAAKLHQIVLLSLFVLEKSKK